MTQDQIDSMIGDPIPEWAVRKAYGILNIGAQLPTRDGRRVGNAHIIDVMCKTAPQFHDAYTVLTDAGNRFVMTAEEIADAFWPPVWIADIGEVIVKFSRE